MSFFSELKRRNVIRVATAYVVASWLIIQVVETILPAFGYGDAFLRYVVIILGAAFIPVLVFSWVFEFTPQGLKREVDVAREDSITRFTGKKLDRIIMLLLALAVGYFLFDRLLLTPAREAEIAVSARQEGIQQAREQARLQRLSEKSIAVLPFHNLGTRPEDANFADGMHDEVLTRLAGIGQLKVISRTSVLRYRDTDKSLPEIAKELSVSTVLEGSVQRSADQVRITVQLIDAHSDEHLWAETFDRQLSAENLFAIQSEIAASIAKALDARLSPEQTSQLYQLPTASMEAYDLYLQGRRLWAARRVVELKEALQAFEQAVEIDPNFAQPWVGICDTVSLLGAAGEIDRNEAQQRAKQALDTALSLNGQLGEAWATLARRLWGQKKREAAEAAFQKAIELSPNYAMTYMWYAGFLGGQELDQSKRLNLLYKAAELDPMSSVVRLNIAMSLDFLGKTDEAYEQVELILRFDPNFSWAVGMLADLQAWNGRLAEAFRISLKAEQLEPDYIPMLGPGKIYAALGDYAAAEAVRKKIVEQYGPDEYSALMLEFYTLLAESKWQEALMLERLPPQTENKWLFDRARALAYLVGRDYQKAREYLLLAEPRWADPDQWTLLIKVALFHEFDEAISALVLGGCYSAGIFISAGERDMGEALITKTLDFFEKELPRVVEKTYRFRDQGLCYLLNGSHEKALAFFEQRVEHGLISNWFWLKQLPWWDPLRDDPRFIALDEKVDQMLAEQLALLRQMDLSEFD